MNYANPLLQVGSDLGELLEHARSFAAIAADGFNLYLVDETGTHMRLFNAEHDE